MNAKILKKNISQKKLSAIILPGTLLVWGARRCQKVNKSE